jgi:hypothetical protein
MTEHPPCRPELLAPAGGRDAFLAAIANGGKVLERFPPSNLATYRPGRVCRFDRETTGSVIAITPPVDADAIAILNHNLVPDAQVRIGHRPDANSAWTYSTIPAPIAAESFWFRLPAPVAGRRGWRLEIRNLGSAAGSGVAPQIGEFYVGTLGTLPPFVWDLERGEEIVDSFDVSEYGVPFARFLSSRRTLSGRFQGAIAEADALAVESFKRSVQGRVRPFLLIPDLDGPEVLLGRLASGSWRRRVVLPGRADGADLSFAADPWGKTGV